MPDRAPTWMRFLVHRRSKRNGADNAICREAMVDAVTRHSKELERMLPPELLRLEPPAGHRQTARALRPVAMAAPSGRSTARWVGPATPAGVCMAIVAMSCALIQADAALAAAKGGRGIVLLHVLGTALFALVLLTNPSFLRPSRLAPVALVLGSSTALEAIFVDYPWASVQLAARTGCVLVAFGMVNLLLFSVKPSERARRFFLRGLVAGATGSLIISVGAFIAAEAVYSVDPMAALSSLILAVGTLGLGASCLALHSIPVVSWRELRRLLRHAAAASASEDVSRLPVRPVGVRDQVKRACDRAAALVGLPSNG